MPIIKKSNEKLIDCYSYCGKKFSNRADWLLGYRSWHKMGNWSYWKKKVRSLDFCCIIILMDNLAYLATNFYERDEHKPIEKFCTLCALEDESHCFFSLRRSLVFYSKALQFLFLGFLLHHNLLQIAWLSFCLSKQHWQSQMELESLTF